MRPGPDQIQGTMNGLGERCGNLDWTEFLPLLKFKLKVSVDADMKGLYKLSRYIARMTSFTLQKNKPFVGTNAFSHNDVPTRSEPK